ncbi:aminoacyl tRNA synthase complex-interacting multifunctional protein 1 isoform X3 [Solanum pennellii]|uniref:Aminoacyl tRNA synthase complex-interacting multifunctional protein 1 isoform X3 n=1 Tax=Solanum pennellii TaxID=28526 RepID=A0ABM1VDP4_SOLPN|nr:aminoacyl tRNA synthase complex-interacting multifunctional protein 1 isoform X3 [Solanum pennellii]
MAAADRKQNIVSALCKHLSTLSLDPNSYSTNLDKDIKSLCIDIFNSSPSGPSITKDNELMKWVEFASNFPVDSGTSLKALSELNEDLSKKSVILGNGLKISEADIVVFAAVHSSVISLSNSDRNKLPYLLRWMDYIQTKGDVGDSFQKILLEKVQFEPPKKAAADNQTSAEKKLPEKVDDKDKDISVSLLKLQIGHIKKAWKHPSAESLLVEEIDVGEAKCRQVVSGLAKFCSPEQLTNRLVVLVTNMKPSKLRDVISEGMVLCASNEDHTVVEPLVAPEGAKVGECISFAGHDGKPEDVLNPKKKQFEKIAVNLFTDDKGVATFKGIPFMTSAGPCTSSIPRATVK